jgi:predicted nucleotidyltransferase
MRLSNDQIQKIRQLARQMAGDGRSSVRVFGSRLDDNATGGDLDLMLVFADPVDNPALIAAQMAAKASRIMHGRKVDVLLSAPNLMRLPIHDVAFKDGVLL